MRVSELEKEFAQLQSRILQSAVGHHSLSEIALNSSLLPPCADFD